MGSTMSDISEEDWERIYAVYKKRKPDSWPDRSLIVDEMITAYCADAPCAHLRLEHEIDVQSNDWCPKGCEGNSVELTVRCKDCGAIVYQISEGHEGCKYGR